MSLIMLATILVRCGFSLIHHVRTQEVAFSTDVMQTLQPKCPIACVDNALRRILILE